MVRFAHAQMAVPRPVPSEFDSTTRVLTLPVRIRNTSMDALFTPMVASLTSIGEASLVRSGYLTQEDVVTIVNAANGKAGVGATFDFSNALGTLGYLSPGAVSGPVDFKVRVATPAASGLRWQMVVSARIRR